MKADRTHRSRHRSSRGWCCRARGPGLRAERHAGVRGRTGAARLFSLPRVGHGFGVTANWEPQFVEAYRAIANARRAEQPAGDGIRTGRALVGGGARDQWRRRDTLAILLTGDGGWADFDKSLAAGLSAHGVPVVGWSSLGYYWTPRSPRGRLPIRHGSSSTTRRPGTSRAS